MEHLYSKLKKLENSGIYAFHMPGHKRNTSIIGADLPYGIDITEINGFDDLHHPDGILKEVQQRASELYQADETHYLINGSTVGLLSAILGCTHRGDRILMARNCHKSVYNAVFLNGLRPVYIYPDLLSSTGGEEMDLNGPVTAEQVGELLEKSPEVSAVVITSPTYDGVVSDVQAIAERVHAKGIPLILDEAHGAHFGFHQYFPENGNKLGADIVIHSLHKTLPSLTQTALLHMNGTIADRDRVRMYLDILQSSSPSYVLMASIDECVQLIKQKKKEIFGTYTDMLKAAREELGSMEHLRLWESKEYDRSKILISIAGNMTDSGVMKKYTGKRLYDELRGEHQLELEMSTPNYVIAMTAPGDTENGMSRLVAALKEIDGKLAENRNNEFPHANTEGQTRTFTRNDQIYSCEEIKRFTNKRNKISFAQCTGYISTEYAYTYPPGIPLVVPGERISESTMHQIINYQKGGFDIRGTKEQGKIEVLENE